MYELVIIWDTGEREVHRYPSEDKANEIGYSMRKAFGRQIAFWCVRRAIK